MKCYIFDIDGTIEHMQPVLHALMTIHDVVFVSGRPEHTRKDTVAWLRKHNFWFAIPDPKLYMRRDREYRPTLKVKRELLDRLRGDGYVPQLVFDDRDQVVNMWRDAGIPCVQVAPGDF